MHCNKLVFVLFDGINNSVFSGMVWTPLKEQVDKKIIKKAIIISFEKLKENSLKKEISKKFFHPKIDFIFFKRTPFCGKISLYYAIQKLKNILAKLNADKVIARGALAGFSVIKSQTGKSDLKIVIQARGLTAEEYRFSNKKESSLFKKLIKNFIYYSLKSIEIETYSQNNRNVKIEAVSMELKNYIIKNFHAKKENITISKNDLIQKIDHKIINRWKLEVRKKLNIKKNDNVYVYSGSIRPWQCVDSTLEYFKKMNQIDKSAFLLILTQDKREFENKIEESKISKNRYKILTICSENVPKYLAAANYGLLFRENDIINWVSRPTKMLEYQSVGLKIIHNNSVAALIKQVEST